MWKGDWHPFHPCGSEVISVTEERRPNTVVKDAPLLLFQEILRVLGAVSQGKRPNVYEKYTLVIWMTKYIFLVIHNVTVTIFSPVMRFLKISISLATFKYMLLFISVTMLNITSTEFINLIIGNLYLLTPFTHFPYSPSSLWQSPICSVYAFALFFFLDSTKKWHQTVFVFLWLISLNIMPSSSTHVIAHGKIYSFYCWTTLIFHCIFSIYIFPNISTYICIYQIFFIHSSPDGQLDCFMSWLLYIMMQWTWACRYLFEIVILFPWGKYPEMELLDHMVVLFYLFEEPAYCFPLWLYTLHSY